jgi:hypothetical protein
MAFPQTLVDDSPPPRSEAASRFASRSRDVERHNPHVDAGWWPGSSNLAAELVHLLDAAQTSGFRASRVSYRLDDPWITPPRHVMFDGRQVRLSGYHNHHRDMVTLVDGASHERMQVMVVPPDTARAEAERAVQLAAERTDPTPGAEILVLARDTARAAVVIA